MYKIIGADGREYGPVHVEQLWRWISEGRAGAQTLVQSTGSTDWRPLAMFPEFTGATVFRPSAPMPAAAPQPWRKTNGLAVTGLILGCIGLTGAFCCCGPILNVLGIVFSSIALAQINNQPTRYDGKALAVIGLVLSVAMLVIYLILTAAFLLLGSTGKLPSHQFQWSI